MNAPICCDHVFKRFGRVSVLNDLQLEVPEGSIYALIGENGAGKTTLIKMLVNILRPSAGVCRVLDADTRKLSPSLYEQIGYVSENQDLPEWMTVGYFLKYLKPFYPNWDDSLAAELVREFQLPSNRRLGQLSRGMKMKAALASSLAYHPRLILLDEPFSGLDALVRDELIEGLLERAADTTILVSSHDLGEIESFASHIGFLERGRMQYSESSASLAERFREIQITFPQSPVLPAAWPESWSKPQVSNAVVRFVESQFDTQRTLSMISNYFHNAFNVSVQAMSLREIFVSLAREHRRTE